MKTDKTALENSSVTALQQRQYIVLDIRLNSYMMQFYLQIMWCRWKPGTSKRYRLLI